MSDFSSTREAAILNDIASGGLEVSLHTADEGNEPDGSNEVSANDYERATIAEADLSVTGSGPTLLSNDVLVDFGTAQTGWGTVTHFAFWTGATAETRTVAIADGPHDILSGESVTIPEGQATVSAD